MDREELLALFEEVIGAKLEAIEEALDAHLTSEIERIREELKAEAE